mgnify:CR=1 FL=1
MTLIWASTNYYERVPYANEKDLESAILQVQERLFGTSCVYLDVKKKVDKNIPDGYLIDLKSYPPRLYVVENELAEHDSLRHIAVQLLEFSLSIVNEPRKIHQVLMNALKENPIALSKCNEYWSKNEFRNIDHFLDVMVHKDFAALLIIDEMPERLNTILATRLKFPVETIELVRYQNHDGQQFYTFEPFSPSAISIITKSNALARDPDNINTVVVPANIDGFNEVFIGENRWYAIRLGVLRPQIKYLAVYQTAPRSAITYFAPISSIEPWQDSGKFVVNFADEPQKLDMPIQRGSRLKHLQNILYTNLDRLRSAKTLDDL